MKICPVGAELFHADVQTDGQKNRRMDRKTDMKKLIVAFRKFVNAQNKAYNAPENVIYYFSFYGYINNETLELFIRSPVRKQTVNTTAHFFL
jgi:hypothetical protein